MGDKIVERFETPKVQLKPKKLTSENSKFLKKIKDDPNFGLRMKKRLDELKALQNQLKEALKSFEELTPEHQQGIKSIIEKFNK